MRIIKYPGLLAVIIVVILSGCAKKPAVIEGRVTGGEGEPLPGAAVFTIPQQVSTFADTAGVYTLADVPPGDYSIMAKFDSDSTVKLLGEVAPGTTMTVDIVIFKTEPPPPPEPPKPKEEPKPEPKPKPKPKPKPPLTDPALKTGAKVLHLGTMEFIKKYEIESSDGLVWTFKDEKATDLDFRGGRLFGGYFAGPYHKYWETAARMLEYDGKIWIYVHGPEKVVEDTRSISIAVPLDLPANAEIDSIIVEYGIPKYSGYYEPGTIQLRMLGETASDITLLMEWKRVDHDENGLLKHDILTPRGADRKLQYVVIEVDSDGDAYDDDLMIRPLVYFSLR
jgi:hypothetical protein